MAGRFEIHQLSLGAYGKAFVPKGKIEFSGNTVSRAFFQKVYYGTFKQWENKNSGSSRTRKTYDISQISLVLELPAAQAHGDFFVSQYALEKNSYPFQLLSRPPNSMNYYSDSEALLKPLNTLCQEWAGKWSALLNREIGLSTLDIGPSQKQINSWNASLEGSLLRIHFPSGLLENPSTRSETFDLMAQASIDFKRLIDGLPELK